MYVGDLPFYFFKNTANALKHKGSFLFGPVYLQAMSMCTITSSIETGVLKHFFVTKNARFASSNHSNRS